MKMKLRKKRVLKIVIAVVAITLAVSFVLPIAYSPWTPIGIFITAHQANRMRVRLLCKTDHNALLEACRELSKELAAGDLNPGKYRVRSSRRPPAVSGFPQTILDLKPNYVFIDRTGRVMVEMLGGLGHFGVQAYPENYKKPSYAKYGDKKLIPGLWYYDDGYNRNPEYVKSIDALMQKGK